MSQLSQSRSLSLIHRRSVCAILPVLFLLLAVGNGFAKDKVVVVSSYHDELEQERGAVPAIKQALGEAFDVLEFYMDTKRLPDSEFADKADEALNLIDATKPKVVFLGDDNALKYLGNRLAERNCLTVYYGINNNPRNVLDANGLRSLTGILERPLIKRGIGYMRELVPETDKVLVLIDNTITSSIIKEETVGAGLEADYLGMPLVFSVVETLPDIEQKVVGAKDDGYGFIAVGPLHNIRSEGRIIPMQEVMKRISMASSVPFFSFWHDFIGKDRAIGGFAIDMADQGTLAANLADDIMTGKLTRPLAPQIPGIGHFVFSGSQLVKWGLQLPEWMTEKSRIVE